MNTCTHIFQLTEQNKTIPVASWCCYFTEPCRWLSMAWDHSWFCIPLPCEHFQLPLFEPVHYALAQSDPKVPVWSQPMKAFSCLRNKASSEISFNCQTWLKCSWIIKLIDLKLAPSSRTAICPHTWQSEVQRTRRKHSLKSSLSQAMVRGVARNFFLGGAVGIMVGLKRGACRVT